MRSGRIWSISTDAQHSGSVAGIAIIGMAGIAGIAVLIEWKRH